MTALLQAGLPVLAGLTMLWAGLVALAGEGDGELGARAMARGQLTDGVSADRILHIIHLASLTLAALLAGVVTAWWLFPTGLGMVRVVLVIVLVWVLGDLAPRLLALLAPEVVPIVRRIALASAPLFAPLLWMARRLDRSQGAIVPGAVLRPGGLTPREMALGVFSLAEMIISEVMTPRIDIVAVDVSDGEDEVVRVLRQSEHARLLVYDGHPDAVVGVLHAKDMLPRLGAGSGRESLPQWQSLIRPAAFIPEAKSLERQLRDFQRGRGHLAVVVDEYGGTAGLVTLEDILEQIVGEIQDEHDVDEVEPVQHHADGHLTVQGGVALVDLEAELEHTFAREDVDTVGGLILAELGRVPRSGEVLTIDRWRFVVDVVVRRRVRRVAVWPLPDDDTTTSEATA